MSKHLVMEQILFHIVDFFKFQCFGSSFGKSNDETQVVGIEVERKVVEVFFALAQCFAQAHSAQLMAKVKVVHVHVFKGVGKGDALHGIAIECRLVKSS